MGGAGPVPVAGDPAFIEDKAGEPTWHSPIGLLDKSLSPHEGMVQSHRKAKTCLQRRRGLVQILAPQRKTGLEAKGVPGPQSAGCCPRLQKGLEQTAPGRRIADDLTTTLPGVPGARHRNGLSLPSRRGDTEPAWRLSEDRLQGLQGRR